MSYTQIFINMAVTDLEASKAFYLAMGGKPNPEYTDETSAQVVFNEAVAVQLMTHEQFSQFTSRKIASDAIESIHSLSADSKEEVDRLVEAALAAGGTEPRPVQDMGWLYNRAVDDPDGHSWELLAFNAAAVPEAE
ncbi:VOC family protein [Glycomyces tenuis]|uniref:VOC family protein n=1 Tax=Glycomyces tenuis TaxID=58116 RepID=UPI00041898E7|nr:VOC family protein [Glycomyces tenuis]